MAVVLVGALAGLVPQPAGAQVADGVIEVMAQDESKAVLPGVTVTVLRPDTGFTQTNVTDAAGIGFDDSFQYEDFALPLDQRRIPITQVGRDAGLAAYQLWARRPDHHPY
jgi:hypothetical protein